MCSGKTRLSLPFALLATTCFVAALAGDEIPPQPVDGKINWVYSYRDGQKLALDSGKPMFVVFRCER